jgi:hypothetical protein
MKSLLSAIAALALATATAFANEAMPSSSLETTDQAYSAQSEPMMTDALTMAESGQEPGSDEVWLDSEHPLG